MKLIFVLIILGFNSSPALGQTKSDSQTLQQILDELRAIHRDVRANSTTQLLLAELQLTQTSLDRAIQRRDTLRSEVARLQGDEKVAQAEVARAEEAAEKALEAALKAQLADRLVHAKEGLTRITAIEHGEAEQLRETETRVRTAQTELEGIQGQLSELVKKLGPVD